MVTLTAARYWGGCAKGCWKRPNSTRVAPADSLTGYRNKSNAHRALELVLLDSSTNLGLIWPLTVMLDT